MNKLIEQKFIVPFSYSVYFTHQLFHSNNTTLTNVLKGQNKPKVFYVIDQGVSETHPELVSAINAFNARNKEAFTGFDQVLIVPGGEDAKNQPELIQNIIKAVHEFGIDRHSFLVGIGGGAVLDAVGYAAAIAHRGIRHIRIPTTVLSQNDSGVGVKNGVNAFNKKNFLGTFAPPYCVINDFDFLTTLDDRDWRSGISEAVKVALIKDAAFFNYLCENARKLRNREMEVMEYLIFQCADMHLKHIAGGDPFEMGSSRPLDFGHWAAHKLEQLTNYSLRHGEAVAIGIALDSTYSYMKGMITEADLDRILKLFVTLGFDLYVPEMVAQGNGNFQLINGLEEFREHLGGVLTIMLLNQIGEGVEVHEMDNELILNSIQKLKAYQQGIAST